AARQARAAHARRRIRRDPPRPGDRAGGRVCFSGRATILRTCSSWRRLMTDSTALGDRMKLYERAESARRCMPLLPICARIDGKRFSRFTAGLARPYDQRLSRLMIEVTKYLIEHSHARVGYTQSDEISLLYQAESFNQQVFLDGRVQKLTSILASMATAQFNALLSEYLPERAGALALFDCRVWTVPNREEASNVFLWRERDATKNSISMAAQHHYSHAEL